MKRASIPTPSKSGSPTRRGWTEEQDRAPLGQARNGPSAPKDQRTALALYPRRDLSQGQQGRGARHAALRHRGDEPPSRRNRHPDRARRPRRSSRRSGGLASLGQTDRPAQHHADPLADKTPGAQPTGKRLAIHGNSQAPPSFLGCGGLCEVADGTKVNRIANEQESTESVGAMRVQFSREMRGECLGVTIHARKLALEPDLQILPPHRRPLPTTTAATPGTSSPIGPGESCRSASAIGPHAS